MHIVAPRIYLKVFAALMVLLVVTVAAARIDLGPFNLIVALVIAITKMLLIMLFFMHVKYSSKIVLLAAATGFAWLTIMLAGTLHDYISRHWVPLMWP